MLPTPQASGRLEAKRFEVSNKTNGMPPVFTVGGIAVALFPDAQELFRVREGLKVVVVPVSSTSGGRVSFGGGMKWFPRRCCDRGNGRDHYIFLFNLFLHPSIHQLFYLPSIHGFINLCLIHAFNSPPTLFSTSFELFQSSFLSETSLKYNKIQYKNEYYYSGINPVEFRGHKSSSSARTFSNYEFLSCFAQLKLLKLPTFILRLIQECYGVCFGASRRPFNWPLHVHSELP